MLKNIIIKKKNKKEESALSVWSDSFTNESEPSLKDIKIFVNSPYWDKLNNEMQEKYKITPKLEYSKCPAQKGWNVKYKKSGKNLCTLYPCENYFIALIVVNEKMLSQVELVITEYSEYSYELFNKTKFSCGGKWLMFEVKNENILNDLIKLIDIRAKTK